VTLRAVGGLGSLRDNPAFLALWDAIAAASFAAFRVIHFSIQHDHLHLIVEADDRKVLSRGMQGLSIRAARALNRALERRGRVWADRYHARALTTPREARAAIVYVLQNWRKTVRGAEGLDGCSTARWFDGWKGPRPRSTLPEPDEPSPVCAARSWLLTQGWRRGGGPIRFAERPRDALD
jgi:hypothetical protein